MGTEKMKRHPKGDADVFRQIAQEREPISYISGICIGELGPQNFAHILPKGRYPELRHDPENIVLLTSTEHSLWDHGTEAQRVSHKVRMSMDHNVEVKWKELEDLKQELLNRKTQDQ